MGIRRLNAYYIRGFHSQPYMIVDEAQNLTPHEIKTIVTRAERGPRSSLPEILIDRQPLCRCLQQWFDVCGGTVQGPGDSRACDADEGGEVGAGRTCRQLL